MGVPIAVATALYLTELCPRAHARAADGPRRAARRRALRGVRAVGHLLPRPQARSPPRNGSPDRLSFIPFVGGGLVTIPNCFIAGLILAIMILPIVSAIAREVMTTVPPDHQEAALGLGATRWEMVRIAVIPYCRSGIVGGAMLGLGRAIGETIAVTIVIGDCPHARPPPLRPGLHARRRDRQRVRRGHRPAPLRAVRRRARAVRAHPARQRARPPARAARLAQQGGRRPGPARVPATSGPRWRRAHEPACEARSREVG